MIRIFILFLIFALHVNASNEAEIKRLIGSMLIVGFPNEKVDKNSQIIKDIKKYDLAGVVLFDRFYEDRSKVKNIRDTKQLKILTSNLQKASKKHLIIAVDQEGGKVARLKSKYGFKKFPSAKEVGTLSQKEAKETYTSLAKMLKENGINCDFAPVVDLSVNPKNYVITTLERSFGKNVKQVTTYASICMDAMKKQNILTSLKHFPGHGSSMSDSHDGFVDITQTWSEKELEPYKNFIASNKAKMIMTAHVFNKNLDDKYPATLSYKINTKLLREKLGFNGVIISDDLQMKAIREEYSLNKTVTLAINAGLDILLFANQLDNYSVKTIVDTIYEEILKGNIKIESIKKANERINLLKDIYM